MIKKKKLDRKRSKKRVGLVKRMSSDGKFSDKFSDITKTTDDSASLMSDEASEINTYFRQTSDRSGEQQLSALCVGYYQRHPENVVVPHNLHI